MAMRMITFYIYSNVLPDTELILYRCLKCSRPLFKASSEVMIITNAQTPNLHRVEPGKGYLEVMCHSCKTEYRVLFQ